MLKVIIFPAGWGVSTSEGICSAGPLFAIRGKYAKLKNTLLRPTDLSVMNNHLFWYVMLFRLLDVFRRFGRNYLHIDCGIVVVALHTFLVTAVTTMNIIYHRRILFRM